MPPRSRLENSESDHLCFVVEKAEQEKNARMRGTPSRWYLRTPNCKRHTNNTVDQGFEAVALTPPA